MLAFMNSKLLDKLVVLTNKTIFSKKVNPIKYPVQTYILVRTWNLLFMYFTGVSHWIMKSRLSVKKHLTWLKLYLVIISALELKVNKPKNHLSLTVPKTFDFSQNSSVLFHRVTCDHSISFVLLIVEPNECCKNSKNSERNT